MGIGEALTIIVGTFISGGTQATNWSRFADSGCTATIATLAAFFLANGFVVFGGAFCSLVLGGATIALALAWGGIYGSEQFINFLILLGTFIPPIGGVVMGDYWLHHKGKFPSLEEQPAFNWAGIIAYVVASGIAYFSPGIKPINGIIAAVIAYFVLSKFTGSTTSRKVIG
jgi:cytosine permease